MPYLLSVLGQAEELLSSLYPYRFILGPVAAAIVLGAILLALRAGAAGALWRHRIATAAIGLPLLAASVVAGDYLLSPLWERSYLEEESPLVAVVMQPAPAMGTDAAPMPAVPVAMTVVQRGSFAGADSFHFGRGTALLIHNESGVTVLRFEDFSVRNGPDLYVYLSRDPSPTRADESLNLGRLKATDGAFNYEIPAGIDLSGVQSVIVWCRQFATLFATASLM